MNPTFSTVEQPLTTYFKTKFPWELVINWLSGGDMDKFYKREISIAVGDIVIRHKSFKTLADFKDYITRPFQKPDKIDIGAVFSVPPAEKMKFPPERYIPKEKEFVLDIDLTDYDEIRFCGCTSGSVCRKCWNFMNCACEVLEEILKTNFGAQHILWVFSGRRGIHCWICDPDWKKLEDNVRASVIDYLRVQAPQNKLFSTKDHPQFDESSKVYKICEKYFKHMFLNAHDCFNIFESREVFSKWLKSVVPEEEIKAIEVFLKDDMFVGKSDNSTTFNIKGSEKESENTWDDLTKDIQKSNKHHLIKTMIYNSVYPKLDENVSKHMNHLLKSPFCIHPKTGLVCVPFNREEVKEDFFPTEDITPTLEKLVVKDKKDDLSAMKFDKSIEIFKNFVNKLYSK